MEALLLCEVDHHGTIALTVLASCHVVVQPQGGGQLHHLDHQRLLPVPGHVDGDPVEGVGGGGGRLLGSSTVRHSKEKRSKKCGS